jgi:hypothetical protein
MLHLFLQVDHKYKPLRFLCVTDDTPSVPRDNTRLIGPFYSFDVSCEAIDSIERPLNEQLLKMSSVSTPNPRQKELLFGCLKDLITK